MTEHQNVAQCSTFRGPRTVRYCVNGLTAARPEKEERNSALLMSQTGVQAAEEVVQLKHKLIEMNATRKG